MPRKSKAKAVDPLIAHLDSMLTKLKADRRGLKLRQKVHRIIEISQGVKDLGVSVVAEHGIDASAARERIRLYLIEYVGTVVESSELEVVSGISEFARRVRELRVECGYHIASGASPDSESGLDLKPDQYLLISKEPDSDAARRWHIANRIRRGAGGAKKRILQYLQENVGKIVTSDELSYVARNAKEFGRRSRELRTEEGYSIATRFTGRPDLGPGQYVLQSLDRVAEPHDRKIPDDIQKEVYERDQNRCRACGWIMERSTARDPRILELHHLEEHAKGGKNLPRNLIVICSRCHDDVHAERLLLAGTGEGEIQVRIRR